MSRGCERIIGQRTPTKWCDEESARCSGQVGWLCPALPQHARCRPQHIQSSTPPHLPIDAEGLPSRSDGAVAECCRSSMKSACSRLTSACDRYRDKAEPRQRLRCASNVPRLQAADVHLATPVIKNQRATP